MVGAGPRRIVHGSCVDPDRFGWAWRNGYGLCCCDHQGWSIRGGSRWVTGCSHLVSNVRADSEFTLIE